MPAEGSVDRMVIGMDEALVEHAEHDIHRQHRRREQEQFVRQRGLERLRRALEGDLKARRQAEIGEPGVDRVDGAAERGARREVERDRRHRKLFQMRDLQRRGAHGELGDRLQRHLPRGRGRRGQIDRAHRLQRGSHLGLDVEDHPVLRGLGEDRRDDALAEGVVERIVDRGRRHAETRRGAAVDVDGDRAAVRLQVAAEVGERRNFARAAPAPSASSPATSPDPGSASVNWYCAALTAVSIERSCTGCM